MQNGECRTIPGFPELYLVRQKLRGMKLADPSGYLAKRLSESALGACVRPGMTVAVAVGSRGITDLDDIVRTVVGYVGDLGARAIIVPAMGSHGGATAEGQRQVLEHYGVTPHRMGCPVISGMEVVDLGSAENGLHVYFDRIAAGCDVVIAINRIKEHTDFFSRTESGILKMLAVGLGNQKGASYIHSMGAMGLSENIPIIAKRIIESKTIFGVGIVEDGYRDTALIEVFGGDEAPQKEAELLDRARAMKAKLPFGKVNYLIIEEIGKNISGSGVDTKVIGRIRFPGVPESCKLTVDTIAGLRLTPESHGNAAGVGLLDLISRTMYDAIDLSVTFDNARSSKSPERYKIPMFEQDDYMTVELGLEFARTWPAFDNKVVLIRNTASLEYLYASRKMIGEAADPTALEMISDKPVPIRFNDSNEYISPFETAMINC